MPTLNWIGKDAVINHHLEVPFHLLKDVPELSCGDPGSGNLIVEGDNLVALKALLPYYKGKVKCIYIDPPYNTGNEGWAYNDNVNSPAIRKWLGETVGKEGETLDRHDRWLCMMYPRLSLLRELLTENGAIFISIDDNEAATLKLLLDEIFGAKNFVACAIWNMMDSPKNSARYFSEDHEYIMIYARDKEQWVPNPLPRSEGMIARYKNPDKDPRGPWLLSDLAARNFYAQGRYSIKTPAGNVIEGPPSGSYWRVNEDKFWELDKDNRIWWGKNGSNRPGIKRFLNEVKDGVVPRTLWTWNEVGSTRHSKQELSQILNLGTSSDIFITPKPTRLIERILQVGSNPGDLILDSFGGSGTTSHAVIKMNRSEASPTEADLLSVTQAPSLPRRYITIELEHDVCRTITRERMQRVTEGYSNAKGDQVEGLGGGFRYVTLGDALFDETGQIRNTVRFAELARHVYFTETGEPLPKERVSAKTPLLGIHRGKAIYLLYNGILSDRSISGGNALCRETLQVIEEINAGHEGIAQTVVYGTSQRLSPARLKRGRIDFKQIPYNLRIS
jgi:adenine-specific DNA-methyltransferase